MHNAPAVNFPVGRSRFQGWLLGLTGLVAVSVGLLWCYQADSVGWRQGLFFLVLLVTWVVAAQAWFHSPVGVLRWDGQAWSWSGVDAPVNGVLAVHLDLQFFLILSLRLACGTRIWFWLERRAEVTRWAALRRAVFARGAGQGWHAGADPN